MNPMPGHIEEESYQGRYINLEMRLRDRETVRHPVRKKPPESEPDEYDESQLQKELRRRATSKPSAQQQHAKNRPARVASLHVAATAKPGQKANHPDQPTRTRRRVLPR
jgi:hypothetical protein